MFICSQGLAEEKRASLFCGPSNNYYCSPEQEIMAIRRDQLNHQQNQPTTAQQNMARYLDLEQKRRTKLEQELGEAKVTTDDNGNNISIRILIYFNVIY